MAITHKALYRKWLRGESMHALCIRYGINIEAFENIIRANWRKSKPTR